MKTWAMRTKTVTVMTEVEIISWRKSCNIDSTNGSNVWLQLRRRCCLCRKLFVAGDSVGLCMYMEHGEQYSGGMHMACLPQDDEAMLPLNADEISRL